MLGNHKKRILSMLCATLIAYTAPIGVSADDEEAVAANTPMLISANSGQGTTPADVLPMSTDMTNWKVQLPLFRDEYENSVLELDCDQMIDGYTTDAIDDIFYVDADGWVVMDCPVDGAKTANTSYSRNEFREMLDPNDTANNWEFTGTHILNTTTKVTKAPSNGRTVTSQIHGIEEDGTNGPVLVKVEYDYSIKAVVVLLKTSSDMTAADARHYFYDVDLNQVYDTEIRVTGGSVYVTISSDGRTETFYNDFAEADPNWYDYRGYFKAGNYVQDSTKDYDGEGATVLLKKMDVFHDNNYTQYVPVQSIELSQTELVMGPGQTSNLSVGFTPVRTLNKGINWSVVSGNEYVAVDSNGNVTGIAYGQAVVRATSADNSSVYVDCPVTVTYVPEIATTLVYSASGDNVPETTRDRSGVDLSATGSASSTIANVDGNSVFKVVDNDDNANGRVEFFFTPQETTTTINFDVCVDVNNAKNPNKPQTSCVYIDIGGDTDSNLSAATQAFRLRNLAEYNGGQIYANRWGVTHSYSDVSRNLAAASFDIGEWKNVTVVITPDDGSSNANTATVYIDGLKVADKMATNVTLDMINQVNFYTGTADLISFSVDNFEVYTGTKLPETGELPAPTAITVEASAGKLAVYDSLQLNANVYPDGSDENLTYTVASGDCLAVSSTGLVTATGVGNGTIRIASTKYPDISTEVPFVVTSSKIAVEGLIPTTETLKVSTGEKATLGCEVYPINATEQGLVYTIISGDDKVSFSSNGTITGLENGMAVIRISSVENSEIFVDVDVNVVTTLPAGTVVFEDTFSSANINTASWETATSNVGNTENSIKNGALYFLDNNTGGQPKSSVSFEPQSDTFTIQYDFMLHRDYHAEKTSSANMAFGSGTITTSTNEAFRIRNIAQASGGAVTNRYLAYHDTDNSSNVAIDGTGLTLNKWVTIALETTPDNGTDFANTTSVYIDGVLVVENAPNKVEMATIDQFIFQTSSSDLTEFSIDNFKVWAGDYASGK